MLTPARKSEEEICEIGAQVINRLACLVTLHESTHDTSAGNKPVSRPLGQVSVSESVRSASGRLCMALTGHSDDLSFLRSQYHFTLSICLHKS